MIKEFKFLISLWKTNLASAMEYRAAFISQSIGMILKDTVTGESVSDLNDGFLDRSACGSSSSRATLLPDKAVTVSSPSLSADPSGHKLRATITLCSGLGQNGECITQTITFKP